MANKSKQSSSDRVVATAAGDTDACPELECRTLITLGSRCTTAKLAARDGTDVVRSPSVRLRGTKSHFSTPTAARPFPEAIG